MTNFGEASALEPWEEQRNRRAERLVVLANFGGAVLAGSLSAGLGIAAVLSVFTDSSIPATQMQQLRENLIDLLGSVIIAGMFVPVVLALAAFGQPSKLRMYGYLGAGVALSVLGALAFKQTVQDLGSVWIIFGLAALGDIFYLVQTDKW